jgi:hypothetical protein
MVLAAFCVSRRPYLVTQYPIYKFGGMGAMRAGKKGWVETGVWATV